MSIGGLLVAKSAAYTDTCSCGGTIHLNTDGNGRSIERCDGCHTVMLTPRALPSEHPLLAKHEKEIATARAVATRERPELPLRATDDCERHVSRVHAVLCTICADQRRAKRHRDRDAARALVLAVFG